MCSTTQDETQRPSWRLSSAPTLSVNSVPSLLTYPLHIAPVPPPFDRPSPTTVPPHMAIPPPYGGPPPGVPLAAGVLPLSAVVSAPGGRPVSSGGPPTTHTPPLTGVHPLTAIVSASGCVLPPAGVPPFAAGSLPVGIPPPAGIPPPTGIPTPAGVPAPAGIPPPAGIQPPTGIPPPAGVPPPAGFPAVVSACRGVPLSASVPASSLGCPQLAGIPQPVPISVAAVVAPPAANSTLPPPRFFDPSVPPPRFIPSVLSSVVTSVTGMPMSRATEDMDLDNSASSDEDLGEGFDEEWPICSRRTSSRSRISNQQPSVIGDQGLRLNESQSFASGCHPSELHSMLEKLPVQSDDYFRMGIQQPHMNRMPGTSLPVSGNNFAILSLPPDCNNPLPSTVTDMSAVSGPGLVKGQALLLKPDGTTAVMDRFPGSVNPASGNVSGGLSDVDFRTSSYGGSIVPVGPPPLSVPMKMVPPPLPPLARPLTSSQHFPETDGYTEIGSGGHNHPVPRMDMLGPRIGAIAHRGSVGMLSNPPPGLSGVRNIPRPVPPMSSTVSMHGMVTGVVQGACDTGSRFINPLPSRTFEPADVQPPSQQLFMQGSMNMNPGMTSAVTDIGPVRGHIPGGSGPVSSVNIQFPRNFGADSTLPMNAGSLRCPTEFGSVVRNMVPPASVGFSMRHEVPRIPVSLPNSLQQGVINNDQHSVGPVSQIPRLPLPGQSPGVLVEQRTSLSGPSERLLNALHSLAGMQTASLQDQPSHGTTTGITNPPRFANSPIEGVDAGMQQHASGLKKSLFGLQAGISGFGSPRQSLLPQQNRSDGVHHSQSFGSLPAPPRFSSGQLCFPLSGNISTSMVIWFIHFQSAFIVVICFHTVD